MRNLEPGTISVILKTCALQLWGVNDGIQSADKLVRATSATSQRVEVQEEILS